jgi:hypothetical protein
MLVWELSLLELSPPLPLSLAPLMFLLMPP